MTKTTKQVVQELLDVYCGELGFGIPDTLVATDTELIKLLKKAIKTKTPIPAGDCPPGCFL